MGSHVYFVYFRGLFFLSARHYNVPYFFLSQRDYFGEEGFWLICKDMKVHSTNRCFWKCPSRDD